MKEFNTERYMKKMAQQYVSLEWSGVEEFEIDRQGLWGHFVVKCPVQVNGTAISQHTRERDFEGYSEDYDSYTIQDLNINIGTPVEVKDAMGNIIPPFELTFEEQDDCEETMRITVTDNVENYISGN